MARTPGPSEDDPTAEAAPGETKSDAPSEASSETPFTASDTADRASDRDEPPLGGGPEAPSRGPLGGHGVKLAWIASLLVAFIVGMLIWPATSPYLLPYLPEFLQDPRVLRLAALEARLENLGARVATLTPSDPTPARELARRLERVEKSLKGVAQGASAADPALAGTLVELEKRLTAIEARPVPVAAAGKAGAADTIEFTARLAAIDRAIAELRSRPASATTGESEAAERTQALAGRLEGVVDQTTALAGRLDALDGSVKDLAEARAEIRNSARRQALVLAVGQLDNAVRSGRAYAKVLTTITPLAEGDAEIAAALATLEAKAAGGIATPARLRASFQPLIEASLEAEGRPPKDEWWDYMWHRIAALVTVRRRGEVAGEGAQAALARAEARLERGDVGGALEAVRGLDGGAGEALAPWRAEAEAWLSANGALDALGARAIALLGAG